MNFLTIDLGTTNIKVGCYDDSLHPLSITSVPVRYFREDSFVEFDPEDYFSGILAALKECVQDAGVREIDRIILTGQAESLVVLDKDGKPVRRAISWLDNRSGEQVEELSRVFDPRVCHAITGQCEILTTWPVTKILWLKQKENESFLRADKYLLLKDYIVFRLTGVMAGEFSIYNFSYYFDIVKKDYWQEILDYVGIKRSQLPPLVEPCTDIGLVLGEIADRLSIAHSALVNIGTLDHFAGMIGTGNIKPGIISESTGTVLTIATMIQSPYTVAPDSDKPLASCHYGPFKDSYVLLSTCESGGVCLEWFRNEFMKEESYKVLDRVWSGMDINNPVVFLPYVNGTNAPDFDKNAKGVFYGLSAAHTKYDLSFAVMEGVAHLLANNIDFYRELGVRTDSIYSTGGGSKSAVWNQLKADITGRQVFVPQNEEAASVGCAMIGQVCAGICSSFEEAAEKGIRISRSYQPQNQVLAVRKHDLYNLLLKQMKAVFDFEM